MPSYPNSTPKRSAHRHRIFTLSVVALVLGAMTLWAVPAFADGEVDPASEETTEPTAPPETTLPADEPPAPEAPLVEDPAPEAPVTEDPALQDEPAPELQESQVSSLGDVGAQGKPGDEIEVSQDLSVPLHNNTAQVDEDCPSDGLAYWHFVITPNNGSSAFVAFHLNLGDGVHDLGFVPNGSQTDNVFVAVPDGYTLTSLVTSGSSADITWDGSNPEPSRFNLSHVCPGTTPESGGLEVTKVVVGPAPDTTFTVDVDCTGDTFDGTMIFDENGDKVGGTLDNPVTGIPVDTSCTVTESVTGGADDVQITGSPAVIAADVTSDVTVTNTFNEPETGTIQVEKVLGDEGDVPDDATFEVEVDCDGDAYDTPLTFSPTDLGPKSVNNIPLDTECTVEETENGGATLVTYVPNGGEETDAPTVTVGESVQLVTVTNFFPSSTATGVISVEKAVEGVPPSGTTYEVRVTCTDGTDETLNFNADGGTDEVIGIKILDGGTECTVEETGDGGASRVSYAPQDTTFTLTLENPMRDFTITNVFDPEVVGVAGTTAERGPAGVTVGGAVTGAVTGTLPFTGSSTAGLLKAALWMLAFGLVTLLVARLRWKGAVQA